LAAWMLLGIKKMYCKKYKSTMNDTHVDLYLKGGNLNEYPAIFVLGIF